MQKQTVEFACGSGLKSIAVDGNQGDIEMDIEGEDLNVEQVHSEMLKTTDGGRNFEQVHNLPPNAVAGTENVIRDLVVYNDDSGGTALAIDDQNNDDSIADSKGNESSHNEVENDEFEEAKVKGRHRWMSIGWLDRIVTCSYM